MVPLQKFWINFVAPHNLVVLGAKLALGRQLASSLSSQGPGKGAGTGAGKVGKGKGRASVRVRAKQSEGRARQGLGRIRAGAVRSSKGKALWRKD